MQILFGMNILFFLFGGDIAFSATSSIQEVFVESDYPTVRLQDGTVFQLGRLSEANSRAALTSVPDSAELTTRSVDVAIIPPPQVDLRQFQTGIRSQTGDTCTVFAMTAAIEAAYKRKYGLTLDLSERYLNHVQKSHWIDFNALLPAREIQPETNSGGSLMWHALVLTRYGLSQERTLSFTPDWAYSAKLDDPTVHQRIVDDHNLSPEVFPQAALADARFVPTEFRIAIGVDLSKPEWFKTQLALKREVAFVMKCCPMTDPVPSNEIWDPPSAVSTTTTHAMLMVGYSDQDRAFLVKNSWGRQPDGEALPGGYDLDRDGLLKLSYDWVTRGLVLEALSIVGVADPGRPFASRENPQLFLGRWNMVHDGWSGVLDIYRLPRNAARPGDEDIRIGTYWGPDGLPRRVNGTIAQNRVEFCIDWHNPNQSGRVSPNGSVVSVQPFCQSGTALQFTGYLFTSDPGFVAGTLQDRRDGKTYAFYSTKYAMLSGIGAAGPLSGHSYLGTWIVSRDGTLAEFIFTTFNPKSGEIEGIYKPSTTVDAPRIPIKGIVDRQTSRLSLNVQMPSAASLSFTGFLHSKESGVMSGQMTWGGIATGFVARRTGESPKMLPRLDEPRKEPQRRKSNPLH